ncbi:unnamed protein product [Cuscuta epithymum]|uniref:Uncharacterized protein n=1 Tax=Cuscuta epithymum TaxID=186058 RepID=A0AAV0DQN3_9ASTE|nr:unnamed protein product [Cuscuta epithymum]
MERMVDQYKKMNIEEDVEDAEELEIVVVGLQGIFQDERLMIRPPLEPPPRMMLEVWIQLFHQFILFNSVLPFRIFILFCCISGDLDLDVGDDLIVMTVFGSFVRMNGSTSYITEVINSASGSRDDCCHESLCWITYYLNGVLSI